MNAKQRLDRLKNYETDVETLNISIIDKSDQIYQKLEQLLDERTETVEAIERLGDPLEKLVLRYFYIHGYSRERTARTLDRSASTISRVKSGAIRNLEAVLAPTDK